MYYSTWPGTYSFHNEIKFFICWFKKQIDAILQEIEAKEKMLNE